MIMGKTHTLILKGKKGKEIFDYIIRTAPKILYDDLKRESDEFKESLCAGESKFKNKQEQQ